MHELLRKEIARYRLFIYLIIERRDFCSEKLFAVNEAI